MGIPHLVSVSCNHCGASLQLSDKAKFVTCNYCGSRLAVHRTDSASYTEVLNEIRDTTQRVESNLDVIRLQNDLERLDREWMMERERYMVSDKDGARHVPSRGRSLVGAAVSIIVGIGAVTMASQFQNGWMGVITVFVALGVIASAMFDILKTEKYEAAQARYERRRAGLTERLSTNPQATATATEDVPSDHPFAGLDDRHQW